MDRDSDYHYMLPTDWDTRLGVKAALRRFGCELEGEYGALATLSSAYAGIALFDACRGAAAEQPPLRGRDTQPEVLRGWGGSGLSLPPRSKLLACYSSSPRRPAADGLSSSPFAEAIFEVSNLLLCPCVSCTIIAALLACAVYC